VAEGFVNQPISDKIAVRLVGWDEHDGGYIDNVRARAPIRGPRATHDQQRRSRVKEDYNDVDTYGGRAALRAEVGDNWVITPTVMGQIAEGRAACSPSTPAWRPEGRHFYPENSKDKWGRRP
jgi:iron complex outermembrane receptor protein